MDRLCRQHEGQSSSCRRLSFTVEVCASDPSVWTPNVLRLLVGDVAKKKNGQKPLRVIFLPSLACRDQSQIIDLYRGSGHRSCTCTVNPRTFCCCCCCCCVSRSAFHEFPFFFFFFSCSVAQTLKKVGPLDCKLRLLRRRSLGDKISVAEVMHLLTLNVFSANFRVVLVVAVAFLFYFFFIHFLSYFLFPFFFSVVTSNFFFFFWKK